MRKILGVLGGLVLTATVVSPSWAINFESRAGDTCTSPGDAGNTDCNAGAAVDITPHPAWQAENPNGTTAQWISYDDTGLGGSHLAPINPNNPALYSNPNVAGPPTPVIMRITEIFNTPFGGSLQSLSAWADDTLQIKLNDVVVALPNFTQSTCANGVPGCQPGEQFSLAGAIALGAGVNTLTFEVYQVGFGTNTTDNPFGVMYQSYVAAETPPVPEPGTVALLGTGLVVAAAGAWRRRQRMLKGR